MNSSLSLTVVWSVRWHSLTTCATRHGGVVAALLMHFTSTSASLATTQRSPSNSTANRRPSAMVSTLAVIGQSVELTGYVATHGTLPVVSLPTAAAQAELGPPLASTLTFNSFHFGGSQFCCSELAKTFFYAFCRTYVGPDEEATASDLTASTKNSAEVIFLGQLRHPNLTKLIGYCYENEHRLLVYEFMEKGSLENHLFKRLLGPLPWSTRLQIAVGAARGLVFLHEAEKPVIYRDFKASNILLDEDYKAKLSDFGLAKDGPEGDASHVSTRVMGTEGYCAPEYVMTGHLTAKSDVYSFGVVLLELLTGRRSVDKTRPSREQNLVLWAKPFLKNSEKLNRIMDSSLDGQYSTVGAQRAAALAHRCLSHNQKARPLMRTVLETLEPLLDLDDTWIGPFVYTVTADDKDDEDKVSEDAKERSDAKHHDQRHKLRFPDSTIHCDTGLNRKALRHKRSA